MDGRHCSRSQSQSLSHLSWPPLIEQGCGSAALCAVDVAPHLARLWHPQSLPAVQRKVGEPGVRRIGKWAGVTRTVAASCSCSAFHMQVWGSRAIQRPPDSGAGLGFGMSGTGVRTRSRTRTPNVKSKAKAGEDRSCFEQRAPRHPTSIRTLIFRTPRMPCQPWRAVPCLMLRGVPAMSG